jgi:hypothetical protein
MSGMNDVTRVRIKLVDIDKTWELCNDEFFYCAVHGKCPAVLENVGTLGETVKDVLGGRMYFCKECGKVRRVDIWNNSEAFCDAVIMNDDDGDVGATIQQPEN